MQESNFTFLKNKWPILYDLGKLAEENLYNDPNTTLIKLRMLEEHMVDYMFAYDNLEEPREDSYFNKIKLLKREGLLTGEILDIFHSLRKNGNRAVHESFESVEEAKTLLSLAYKAAVWFMQLYGKGDFKPPLFILPEKEEKERTDVDKIKSLYEEELENAKRELAAIRKQQAGMADLSTRKRRSRKFMSRIELDHRENEKLIEDKSLNDDGLLIDETDNRRKFITTSSIGDNETGNVVWDSVKSSFRANRCVAYWRYPLFKKRGDQQKEPDILILDKELGVIVIEVRDITIDRMSEIDDDIRLAEDQLFTLKGFYEPERELRGRNSPVGRAIVVLTNIDSQEGQDNGLDGEAVIFSNQLGAKTLLNRIKEISPVIPGNILNEKNWNTLLSVISGQSTFRKRDRQKSKDRKTKGGVKNIIKEELYKVDMQQEAIGKTIPPGPQRIRGIAGSGKTILLSQKAAHMHLKHSDWKIALIFFTRSLYDNTIKEVDKWVRRFSNGEMGYDPEMNKNLKIFHAWGEKNREGFYRMICEHHQYRPLSAGSSKLGDGPPNKKLILACKIFLEKQEQINPVFDAVLIDEAQDLLVDDDELKYRGKQPFFWLAYQSLKETGDSREKRLIWAYDEAQSLNSLNVPTARELFGDQPRFRRMVSGFHKGGIRKSEVMNKCYRTPGPILVAAHALGMGLLRPGGMLRGYTTQEDWENIGYEIKEGSFRPGKKIVLHRPEENTPNKVPEFWEDPVINFKNYNTRKEELDYLADSIKNDINQHKLNPSRDILVIVLGDFREAFKLKIEAAGHLMNKGVDIYIPKSLRNNELYPKYPDIDPDKFWNRGGVTITNIHRAKGNEAYMVYVIGLDKIAENEANFSLRNQLFVALTRTKGWLKVMGVGNFPFYNEFRDVLKSGNTFEFTFQRPLAEKAN